jgi:hypothetical protein
MTLTSATMRMVNAETEARIASLGAQIKTTVAVSNQVREDNHRLRMALVEAKLAIEYLHEKFGPTGSTNTALVRIENVLSEVE